jgi:S-adenosylmethionine:tRNA ribosyltransferase-isomerase
VLNDSKVIPARIFGAKKASGGQIEILLLSENQTNDWWVMLRPAKRARPGTELEVHNGRNLPSGIKAIVCEKNSEGHCRLRFTGIPDITTALDELGEVPLPPYIHRTEADHLEDDRARYQTVYAVKPGSVAAPTAGLHFTERLLDEIRTRGVATAFVTLHVGLGTFAPVKQESLDQHVMHSERFRISAESMESIASAKSRGGRVVAVGTTALRALESVAAANQGLLVATEGQTSIFIHPPYRFQVVDALITNFHLPRSTLLMLVSAFASPGETRGREEMLRVYSEAIREGYRFYSYGDAMMIL